MGHAFEANLLAEDFDRLKKAVSEGSLFEANVALDRIAFNSPKLAGELLSRAFQSSVETTWSQEFGSEKTDPEDEDGNHSHMSMGLSQIMESARFCSFLAAKRKAAPELSESLSACVGELSRSFRGAVDFLDGKLGSLDDWSGLGMWQSDPGQSYLLGAISLGRELERSGYAIDKSSMEDLARASDMVFRRGSFVLNEVGDELFGKQRKDMLNLLLNDLEYSRECPADFLKGVLKVRRGLEKPDPKKGPKM